MCIIAIIQKTYLNSLNCEYMYLRNIQTVSKNGGKRIQKKFFCMYQQTKH